MPSPTPQHIIAAALADVLAGMTRAEAARKHGIHRSIITRAIKREASRCPTCGQVVKEDKHVADD